MVEEFVTTVQNRKTSPLEKHKLIWKKAKDGYFSVRSNFDSMEGGRTVSFPKMMVWN